MASHPSHPVFQYYQRPGRLCNAGTPGSINSDPVECEYPENQLTGTVVLDPDCYYEQKFKIKEPDTVLDRNGAELRQVDGYQLDIKLNADRALVRNCYFVGGKGISVRVRKRDASRPTTICVRSAPKCHHRECRSQRLGKMLVSIFISIR